MAMLVAVVRWVSLIVWLVWLVAYWRGGLDLVSGIARSLRPPSPRYGAVYILGIVLLANVMLVTGFLTTTGQIADPLPRPWYPLVIVGTLLIVVGAAGTAYCRYILGRLWSPDAVVLADHKVVDSGPYRLVRHPLYTSTCVMTLGTALVFPAWWNLLAAVAMVGLFVSKMQEEEILLARGLPAYREYQQRVRYRIAPWIW